jgi:hypothetical protein
MSFVLLIVSPFTAPLQITDIHGMFGDMPAESESTVPLTALTNTFTSPIDAWTVRVETVFDPPARTFLFAPGSPTTEPLSHDRQTVLRL